MIEAKMKQEGRWVTIHGHRVFIPASGKPKVGGRGGIPPSAAKYFTKNNIKTAAKALLIGGAVVGGTYLAAKGGGKLASLIARKGGVKSAIKSFTPTARKQAELIKANIQASKQARVSSGFYKGEGLKLLRMPEKLTNTTRISDAQYYGHIAKDVGTRGPAAESRRAMAKKIQDKLIRGNKRITKRLFRQYKGFEPVARKMSREQSRASAISEKRAKIVKLVSEKLKKSRAIGQHRANQNTLRKVYQTGTYQGKPVSLSDQADIAFLKATKVI